MNILPQRFKNKRGLGISTGIEFLDEAFFSELFQRRRIEELPGIDSFGFGIARRDVLHDRFHFRQRDRRHVPNIAEHIAFKRARQQLVVRVSRVLSQHANGKIGVRLAYLIPSSVALRKRLSVCGRFLMKASVVTSAVPG